MLCDSLFIWLRTFELDDLDSIGMKSLTDGIVISSVLHKISPGHFTDIWRSKLLTNATNWRLKTSNLKKVVSAMLSFYSEVLGKRLQADAVPDTAAVAEREDETEMGKLLQLVLGCAVNCMEKERHIQAIMGLEESVQHDVMQAIQNLMSKEESALAESDQRFLEEELKRVTSELSDALESVEGLKQSCHELDLQVAKLLEEKSYLTEENMRLKNSDGFSEEHPLGRKYQQLQKQLENLQEELDRSESAREDTRILAELYEGEKLMLAAKVDELTETAVSAKRLADELDEVKDVAAKVPRLEAAAEGYKRRLEEVGDLKAQINLLEEDKRQQLEEGARNREEIRKLAQVRPQLEAYKRQVHELQLAKDDAVRLSDKAQCELQRLKERLEKLQQDKERLHKERDELRVEKETWEPSKTDEDSSRDDSALFSDYFGDDSLVEMMNWPPNAREKAMLMQREIKQLRERSDDQGELQATQSLLEDSQARCSQLENELRETRRRELALQGTVEDREQEEQSRGQHDEALRRELRQQAARCTALDKDLTAKQTLVHEQENRMLELEERIRSLNTELTVQKEKYVAMEKNSCIYLTKAKEMIKKLDNRKTSSPAEVEALRHQLTEKDQMVAHLKLDMERQRQVWETEQQLMATAFYNMASARAQRAADERVTNTGAGESFLIRQRQVNRK